MLAAGGGLDEAPEGLLKRQRVALDALVPARQADDQVPVRDRFRQRVELLGGFDDVLGVVRHPDDLAGIETDRSHQSKIEKAGVGHRADDPADVHRVGRLDQHDGQMLEPRWRLPGLVRGNESESLVAASDEILGFSALECEILATVVKFS